MFRGTTPTHTFSLSFDANQITKLNIAYAQNNNIVLEKTLEDCTVDGNNLIVRLNEEDTLAFKTKGNVQIQLRVGIGDERLASFIYEEPLFEILKDGVL